MRPDAQRYLEHFCDTATAEGAFSLPGPDGFHSIPSMGIEPFAFGAALRFSPARTKAVMRELLQHNLLAINVVVGSDERNELQMTPIRKRRGGTLVCCGFVMRAEKTESREAYRQVPMPS